MEHAEYTYTVGMDDAEVERRLAEHDTAVLSLARDGEAYAVPVAYHSDDGTIYLRLAEETDSKKLAFVEVTDRASLVLYEADPPEESWSSLATGILRELAGEERAAYDDATINEEFIPLRVFREAVDDVELRIFEFEVETITGRKTTEA